MTIELGKVYCDRYSHCEPPSARLWPIILSGGWWRDPIAKQRPVYEPRIVGSNVMMPADLRPLHKYLLDIERIDHISDEMRAVVESEWPELAHKLTVKKPQN